MSLEISQETQPRLAEEARKEGVSVETLLRRLMDKHDETMKAAAGSGPELPVWHLGVLGSLRRRDIYTDVP